jgi:hypothetical protein
MDITSSYQVRNKPVPRMEPACFPVTQYLLPHVYWLPGVFTGFAGRGGNVPG